MSPNSLSWTDYLNSARVTTPNTRGSVPSARNPSFSMQWNVKLSALVVERNVGSIPSIAAEDAFNPELESFHKRKSRESAKTADQESPQPKMEWCAAHQSYYRSGENCTGCAWENYSNKKENETMVEHMTPDWILEHFNLHQAVGFISQSEIGSSNLSRVDLIKKKVDEVSKKVGDHVANLLTVSESFKSKPVIGRELRADIFTITPEGLSDLVKEIKRRIMDG